MAWPTYFHLLFLHGDIRDHTDEELFLRFVWINTDDLTHLLSPFVPTRWPSRPDWWRVCSSELSESTLMTWLTYYYLLFLHGDLRGQSDEQFVSQSYLINTDGLTHLLSPFVLTRWHPRPHWWRVVPQICLNQHWWLDPPIITILFLHGDLRGQTDKEFVLQSYLNQHWWLDLPIITFCSYTVTYEARLMKSLFLRFIWINTDGLIHLLLPFVPTRWPTRPDWRRVCSSDLSESTLMAWSTYYHLLSLHGNLRGQIDEEFVSQSYMNQHWWLDPPIITILFLHGDLQGQTDEQFVPQSYLNQYRWLNPSVITFCPYMVTYEARLMKSLFLRVIWINTDGLTHLLSLFALTWWPTRPDWRPVCSLKLSDSTLVAYLTCVYHYVHNLSPHGDLWGLSLSLRVVWTLDTCPTLYVILISFVEVGFKTDSLYIYLTLSCEKFVP